jgi:hypothetical protein
MPENKIRVINDEEFLLLTDLNIVDEFISSANGILNNLYLSGKNEPEINYSIVIEETEYLNKKDWAEFRYLRINFFDDLQIILKKLLIIGTLNMLKKSICSIKNQP